jgi:hypothetical protein
VNAALLGTDRAPLAVPASPDALGDACARVSADSATEPPVALLRVAAAASVYLRCGWLPALTDEPLPAVCAPEILPLCPPAAAGLLQRILQGEHEPLLGAWLTLAARHEVRAPNDTLRALLDVGRRDPRLRRLIISAGGARATWLASLNDDWSYATAGTTTEALVAAWETGAGAARLTALQQLRALDPGRALATLEASWAQESATERRAFVAALLDGLSAGDEPFLERALDDRRKEVRQSAAALLARVPTSALVARMTSRATGLISLGKTGFLKRVRVDVTLPATADAALVRDGVEPKAPPGIGERAWWLAQILAAVPPSTWTAASSLEPSDILRAVEGHEWREPVVAGWLTATERHRDTAWAHAFWENEPVARIAPQWNAPPAERVFTTVASPEQVDGELRKAIGAGRDVLRANHPVLSALVEWPRAWSEPLARAVAHRLKEYVGRDRIQLAGEFGLRALLERSAHAVPVSAVDAFTDGWPDQSDAWPTWAPSVDALASVLRFRTDLHLAFNEDPPS